MQDKAPEPELPASDDRRFWTALREAVARGEPEEREEFAAAEQLLAELDAEATAAPARDRIEAWVAAALADEDPAAAALGAIARPAAPVHRFVPLRRFGAAAATLLVAPKFLAAATLVAAVAVTTYVVQNSLETLSFQRAVELMVDPRAPAQARIAAQGRVAGELFDSITVLRAVRAEGGPLGELAHAVLTGLRLELAATEAFELRHYSDSVQATGDRLLRRDLDPFERQRALERLDLLLRLGIAALRAVRDGDAVDEPLAARNAAYLRQLARRLD